MDKKYKKQQFKTPDGYFEDFNARLMKKMGAEGPKLPEKEGFAVPEGYFDKLDKSLLDKLEEEKDPKVIKLRTYRKYYFAAASVAAALLLFFGLTWNSGESLTFDDLAGTEIEAYFEQTELGLNSYELAEMVSVDELEIDDFLESTIDEENIIEYLDENLQDFDDLDGDFGELNLDSDE
ncbi:hypothetical protein [Poritiphilus flavus]|uniref:Uncharacterized protein n=1 Tax=Poritiphilus flavus TaxID=2697053 RepID=A0A6L9EB56_9FLAO|nr:hypothetical protein [Poritiphilus flavus]NAS11669.1 hypothetical protein [Poritiphilus flavus]